MNDGEGVMGGGAGLGSVLYIQHPERESFNNLDEIRQGDVGGDGGGGGLRK